MGKKYPIYMYVLPGLIYCILHPAYVNAGSGNSCSVGFGVDSNGVCKECPVNNYSDSDGGSDPCKPCPTDQNGHQSITKQRGASSCFFTPYIYDFSPMYGPVSGGTNISVHILYMENRTIIEFRVANIGIKFPVSTSSKNSTVFYIISPAAKSVRKGPLSFRGRDINKLINHESISTNNFVYMRDPVIQGITRNKTIISGGIYFKVFGQNLNSTAKPLVLIMVIITDRIIETYPAVDLCTVENITVMICPFPDLTGLDYDIDILNDSTTPSSNSAQSLTRRRRQAHPGLIAPANKQFYVGFQMDGVSKYREFQQIYVYRDPVFHSFTEEKNIRKFNTNETVSINGDFIDYVLTLEDITVEVGDAMCNISYVAVDQINCHPPQSKPSFGENGPGPEESVTVTVKFGRSSIVVGYLMYSDEGISMTTILIIAGVAVAVFLIIIFWCSCVFCCVKRKRKKKNAPSQNIGTTGYTGSMKAKDNSYMDLKKLGTGTKTTDKRKDVMKQISGCILEEKNVIIGECIGKGQFGKVYKGKLRTKRRRKKVQVAIKTVQAGDNDSALYEFLEEALVMKGFSHNNVVAMYGVIFKDYTPFVVLEFMDLGDLKSYVSNANLILMTTDLLKISIQIAEGMAYLALNRFVHRDLAARNCMINSSKTVKIADFGLSRDIYTNDYYRTETRERPLPIRWMALESIEAGVFTVRSDVWSYGVVLWEIFTRGAKPYADVSNFGLKSYLQLGKRLDKPRQCPDPLYTIMQSCWNESGNQRPTFSELVNSTKDMLHKCSDQNEPVNGANTLKQDDYLTPMK